MARKTVSQKNQEILSEIGKNANTWFSQFNNNIQNFRADKRFAYLEQWSETDINEFTRLNKPRLTINKVYDFVKRVVGEQRQNTPNLMVRSINGQASQKDITLRSNIVRHIAYGSRADIVYQSCFENQLVGGWGCIRVRTDYVSSKDFNQDIYLYPVVYPERTFFDVNAKECTKHDGEYCGYYDRMSKKEFKSRWPEVPYPQSFPAQYQNNSFNWGAGDEITIVEYYRKEYYTFKLYELSDGRVVTDKEYTKLKQDFLQQNELEEMPEEGDLLYGLFPSVENERKSRDYKIMCYKACAEHILEKYEWPSKFFPLIYVPGDSHFIDGVEHTLSFVRFARDPQRILNYVTSEIMQAVKNGRREQFIGTPANVSGSPQLANMWKNPSQQQGILLAEPDPVTGQMPTKLPASEIPTTLIQQSQVANLELQSVMGLYEANRGAQGQEVSGVALMARQRTGNMGVAVYHDNLERGVEQAGRVILDLLPKIFDTERQISVQNENNQTMNIVVNKQYAADMVENDLRRGNFDVYIKPGPNFAIQKEQALKLLVDLAGMNPEVFNLVADLIAENVSIEKSQQLVERFRTLVPPPILAKEQGQPPPPPQPNPQQMAAQAQIQLKQQEMMLKQRQMELDYAKAMEQHKIDAAKNELELMQMNQDAVLGRVKAGAEITKARLEHNADVANSMATILKSHTDIAKHNHEMTKELSQYNR